MDFTEGHLNRKFLEDGLRHLPKVLFTFNIATFLTIHFESQVCINMCMYLLVFFPLPFAQGLSYLLSKANNENLYKTNSLSKLLPIFN